MRETIQQRQQALEVDPKALLCLLALTVDSYTVHVSGLAIEGHGNAESDLDALVIYPDEFPSLVEVFPGHKTNIVSIDSPSAGSSLSRVGRSQACAPSRSAVTRLTLTIPIPTGYCAWSGRI
ncbi:hypothetical protein [Thermogemmatispora sp.]|uniref:hypothetical protein n=1 Tax=Thermogemmatispora sp. TaxID=1968838 RepID=UPI0035E3FF74